VKKFNSLRFLLILLLNLLFISPLNSEKIEINKCTIIENQSNKEFLLKRNILAKNSSCITIVNSVNVSLNCQKFNLLGLKFNEAFFISNSKNIIIENCNIRNFEIGLKIENTNNSVFRNLRFFNVNKKFVLNNTFKNKFEGFYQRQDFIFIGENINDYPFFDLNSFLNKYKVSIFLIIFANLVLFLDFIYRRKIKEFVDEDYYYGIVLSLFFAYLAFFILENEKIKAIFYFFSLLSLFSPYLINKFKEYLYVKEIEEIFPVFIMDLSELIKAGIPLPKAIDLLKKNDYSVLTPLIYELSTKLSWGIKIEEAFDYFARKSNSELVNRVIKGLIEAHKSGGDIITFLDSLINNISILNHLKKERESIMYRKIMQFYVLYFFLILTIIGINKFVLPFVQESTKKSLEMTGLQTIKLITTSNKQFDFDQIFFFLALIQSIFSGLIIGKLTADSLKAGIKHLTILFPITYIIMKLSGF